MAEPDPDLTARYLAGVRELAEEGAQAVAAAWDDLGSWDEDDIARLERFARPLLDAIGREAAAETSAYLALVLDDTPAVAAEVVAPDWRGPFTWHWRALGQGFTPEEAVAMARSRARSAGSDAVMSTARRAGDATAAGRITGWRRVPSANACQWCRDVAGQTYGTSAAADGGHDHCHCGVTPILR